MSTDLMRPIRRIEQHGAARGRDNYPLRAEQGDQVAELFGVARMWKRITFWMYLVAIALMFSPVGGTLHYIGVLIWTVGLFPLVCWLAQRMIFRKAVKLVAKPQEQSVPSHS